MKIKRYEIIKIKTNFCTDLGCDISLFAISHILCYSRLRSIFGEQDWILDRCYKNNHNFYLINNEYQSLANCKVLHSQKQMATSFL